MKSTINRMINPISMITGSVHTDTYIPEVKHPQRLLSLDLMRGGIMILLMLEGASLYDHLLEITKGGWLHSFVLQFTHHPWHGLRFWDLIQPGFMFIAGTSLAYSYHAQQKKELPWRVSFLKVFKRSAWLFFWGVLDYAVRPQGLSFELWDVLTQLSFTTLITFLVLNWSPIAQIGFSAAILILTECLYKYTLIPGFDQPFVDQHNFGNYLDLILMNKVNAGGWVAINCLPTTIHTLWGAMVGNNLLSSRSEKKKIMVIVLAGLLALCIGYGLDMTITPIIKRIATSSFVIVSGGWCLLTLAFLYWWIDYRKQYRFLSFFTIVGMNSLFIYLFIEIIGSRWFNGYIETIVIGILKYSFMPEMIWGILTSLVIFLLEWKICHFLYKKKIFFKI